MRDVKSKTSRLFFRLRFIFDIHFDCLLSTGMRMRRFIKVELEFSNRNDRH